MENSWLHFNIYSFLKDFKQECFQGMIAQWKKIKDKGRGRETSNNRNENHRPDKIKKSPAAGPHCRIFVIYRKPGKRHQRTNKKARGNSDRKEGGKDINDYLYSFEPGNCNKD